MIGVHRRPLRLVAAVLAVGALGAACGSPSSSSKGEVAEATTTTIARGPETTAAQLRSRLTGLLGEHVYLAAAATGAAAGGRNDEFTAAASALQANSEALTANFGAVFGEEKGDAFDAAWKKHVESLLGYARGQGAAGQSVQELATLFNSAMPSLSVDAIATELTTHERNLRAAVDAQKGGNEAKAYSDLRAAATHMNTLGATLSGAMARTLPDKIGGDPASKASELITTLNTILREHVFLAAAATDATLAGRTDEFTGASAALDGNSDALIDAVGDVYGAEAGAGFSPLWKKHIGFLFDYANAVRDKDQARADASMESLLQYSADFGAFINTASPKLTTEAVADLIKTHALTLKDVIDAQAAKNWPVAFAGQRTAADHMAMIAIGLGTTVVAQFPEKF